MEVLTVESEFIAHETVGKLGLLLTALQWDKGLGVSGSESFLRLPRARPVSISYLCACQGARLWLLLQLEEQLEKCAGQCAKRCSHKGS